MRIKKFVNYFTGRPERFSLESRIFHVFTFFVLIVLFFETIFNLVIHLYVSAALGFTVFIVQFFLYYLSRYKNQLQLAVILSAIEVNIIKSIGYFYNAGLSGATLLLFAASLFILMSVSQKKWWPALLTFNLLSVLCIIGIEYFYPDSIKQVYKSRGEQFADNLVSYIVTVILLYVGTASIRQSYIKQKKLTDRQTTALQVLNAEKVKLFSVVSHDLRAPLASAAQYFDMLANVELEADERAMLEKQLLKTINNTQELLTNLLIWAKNQMDGTIANMQQLSLGDSLSATAGLFRSIADKKGIKLSAAVDDDIFVSADADMLQLVIRNILNNAVKFTPAGGSIQIKGYTENGQCIISIADDGLGIPAEKQAQIFSLNTVSTPGTLNEQGSGLGLVLCKDYIELQGGRIWFDSAPTKGTTFYISLRLSTASQADLAIA